MITFRARHEIERRVEVLLHANVTAKQKIDNIVNCLDSERLFSDNLLPEQLMMLNEVYRSVHRDYDDIYPVGKSV